LFLIVGPEAQYGGGSRRRVRATFTFENAIYNLIVTDPWIERKCLAGADGRLRIEVSRLSISLSEIFDGFAYKLVAAVITPSRAGYR
jgi:Dual OB-containing domain